MMDIHLEIQVSVLYHEYDNGRIEAEKVYIRRAGLPDLDITDYLFQAELEAAENATIDGIADALELARSKKEAAREDRGAYLREIAQEAQQEALREGVTQRRVGA